MSSRVLTNFVVSCQSLMASWVSDLVSVPSAKGQPWVSEVMEISRSDMVGRSRSSFLVLLLSLLGDG
jgi:hypothetical protein